MYVPIIGDLTLFNVLVLGAGLVIIWIIVSIPVHVAGKFITAGKSSLGDAMVATLFGPVTYAVTLFIVDSLLGPVIGSSTYVWALFIAFVAWVGVFKASFRTRWFSTLAISVVAILVFAGVSLIFGSLLGIVVPAPFFPRF